MRWLEDDFVLGQGILAQVIHMQAAASLLCPFLRWSQMALTRAKWPNVAFTTAAGAHCACTGTVGGAAMWAGVRLRHLGRGGDAGPA